MYKILQKCYKHVWFACIGCVSMGSAFGMQNLASELMSFTTNNKCQKTHEECPSLCKHRTGRQDCVLVVTQALCGHLSKAGSNTQSQRDACSGSVPGGFPTSVMHLFLWKPSGLMQSI